MFFVKICLILNLICIFNNVCGYKNDKRKLDIDYYGRGFVRHTQVNLDCEQELHKQYCRFKCSKSHAICIEGNCYCVKGNTTGLLPSRKLHRPEDFPSKETSEEYHFLDGHPWNTNHEPKIPNSRPIRRHHIAHFCENLDIARTCIRTCMPQGKPAFCGKDHVCYCGHKYKTPGSMFNKKTNVSAMYIQFKDLYDKYFGTKDKTEEVKDNENDNNENNIVSAASKENYDLKNNIIENAGDNVGGGNNKIDTLNNDVITNADEAEETGGNTINNAETGIDGTTGNDEAGGATGNDEAGGATGNDEAGGATGNDEAGGATGNDEAGGATGNDEAGGATGNDEAGDTTGNDEAGGNTDNDETGGNTDIEAGRLRMGRNLKKMIKKILRHSFMNS